MRTWYARSKLYIRRPTTITILP